MLLAQCGLLPGQQNNQHILFIRYWIHVMRLTYSIPSEPPPSHDWKAPTLVPVQRLYVFLSRCNRPRTCAGQSEKRLKSPGVSGTPGGPRPPLALYTNQNLYNPAPLIHIDTLAAREAGPNRFAGRANIRITANHVPLHL